MVENEDGAIGAAPDVVAGHRRSGGLRERAGPLLTGASLFFMSHPLFPLPRGAEDIRYKDSRCSYSMHTLYAAELQKRIVISRR